jgi:hypothetical protein
MSKADAIRQHLAQPHVKAKLDQDASATIDHAAGAVTRKVRRLVADATETGELDELAMEVLVAKLVALISLDPASNAALIRELLPAYVAQHVAGE